MPVIGKPQFLKKAILSVQNQEQVAAHLIIVRDRTIWDPMFLYNLLGGDLSGIEVCDSPGSGIVEALNFGLKRCQSDLIARIDSDDLMASNRLRLQSNFLSKHSNVVCVGSQMTFIDEDDLQMGNTNYPMTSSEISAHLQIKNCIGHPSVMFKRQAVMESGGYTEALTGAEDYDLWLRLSKLGELRNMRETLTSYRISDSQYSKSLGKHQQKVEELARARAMFPKVKIIHSQLPEKILEPYEIDALIHEVNRQVIFTSPFNCASLLSAKLINRAMETHLTSTNWVPKLLLVSLALTLNPWKIVQFLSRWQFSKHDRK